MVVVVVVVVGGGEGDSTPCLLILETRYQKRHTAEAIPRDTHGRCDTKRHARERRYQKTCTVDAIQKTHTGEATPKETHG